MKMKHALYLIAVELILTAIIFAYGTRIERGILWTSSQFDDEFTSTMMTNSGSFFSYHPDRREKTGQKIKVLMSTGFDDDETNDKIIYVF